MRIDKKYMTAEPSQICRTGPRVPVSQRSHLERIPGSQKSAARIMQIILVSLSSPYTERRLYYVFMGALDNTNKDV